jgi:hypothetical protein
VLYFGGLIRGLVHPIYPLISYLVFYYAPPQLNNWGNRLPDLRWSLTASAVIAASIVILNTSVERLKEEKNPALPWLLLFGLNTIVVTAWALIKVRSWFWTVAFLKLIVLYLLIPAAIRTPAQFEMFAITHVAGATYWGYKAWDDPHRKSGRLIEVGGPDTQNDNLAAAHLVTALPFVALYALTKKRKINRATAVVAGAFIVNCFILCNSRGATLGLIVAGGWAIVLAGKGRRSKMLGIALAGGLFLLWLADPEFIQRQQTTANPKDNSAQSRLAMWRGGWEMVKDYPFGAGGRAFHILSPRYIPDVLQRTRAEERSSHNTYIQLATEWGIQGTVLYLIFMITTFRMLRQIRRRASGNDWYFYRSLAIQVALIGTWTAGVFSNRLYGESIYWLCALAFALHRIQSTELANATVESPIMVHEVARAGWHPATRPQELPAR